MTSSARSHGRAAASTPWVLGAVCALAFVLRLLRFSDSLYGDELFTLRILSYPLGGVWHQVYTTSITPPLHYYLAWVSIRLGGDPTEMLRLPSLVLGTATVPLVFAIGRRLGGDRLGLLAATVLAVDPFELYYGSEGRAYVTVTFLVTAAVLCLLRALDTGQRRWWALYAVAGCATLWTHYTGVFVIGATVVWALAARPRARRAVLASVAAMVVGFLPWIPGFLAQRSDRGGVEIIGTFGPLTPTGPLTLSVRTLLGLPDGPLGAMPGTPVLVVLAAVLVTLGVSAARRASRPLVVGSVADAWRSEVALVVLCAVATVGGLLLYAAAGSSLFLLRNLSASAPMLAIVVAGAFAWLARRARPDLAAVASVVLVVVLGVGAIRSLGTGFRRPPYREAAAIIDASGGPADPVIETNLSNPLDPKNRPTTIDLYLRPGHPVVRSEAADSVYPLLRPGHGAWQVLPEAVWGPSLLEARSTPSSRVSSALLSRVKRIAGADGRLRIASVRVLDAHVPLVLLRFDGEVSGRLEHVGGRRRLRWNLGPDVEVVPGAVRGRVETIAAGGLLGGARLSGWAATRTGEPASWYALLDGTAVIGASAGGGPRPDVVAMTGTRRSLRSGFAIGSLKSTTPPDPSRLRVLAVSGRTASLLPPTRAYRTQTRRIAAAAG